MMRQELLFGCMLPSRGSMKGKSSGSARWLRRQLNDPLVKQAQREGLRSRAAFKLRELNTKYQLIKKGDIVLDLGAAPGGWTQVAVESSYGDNRRPKPFSNQAFNVIALDLKRFDPIEGASIVIGDFRTTEVRSELDKLLNGRKVDVVISDMAPPFSGNFLIDSSHQIRLCYNALKMAELYLKEGGHFTTKILRCDGTEEFREELKTFFHKVKGMKPLSSRSESTEMFLIAKSFKRKIE